MSISYEPVLVDRLIGPQILVVLCPDGGVEVYSEGKCMVTFARKLAVSRENELLAERAMDLPAGLRATYCPGNLRGQDTLRRVTVSEALEAEYQRHVIRGVDSVIRGRYSNEA